jgi:non-ribosomal peptide synthetase component F
VPGNAPQTTRFTRIVTAIADIVALETSRYDDLIPARNLYHLFEATALLHPDRPALTVMKTGDLEEAAAHFSHRELLGRIAQAANLFRSLGVTPDSGPVAFLCPALAHMQVALLGAQVAGRQFYQLSAHRGCRSRSADRGKRRGAGDPVRGGRSGELAQGRHGDGTRAVAALRSGDWW